MDTGITRAQLMSTSLQTNLLARLLALLEPRNGLFLHQHLVFSEFNSLDGYTELHTTNQHQLYWTTSFVRGERARENSSRTCAG